MSIFMQVPGITGDASNKNHKGWIDVAEASFDVTRKITSNPSTQNDRESSNASFSVLELVKLTDKSSPQLFIEACCGRGKTIKIALTKTGSGSGSDVFMEYTLENCLLSKFETQIKRYRNLRPVEIIELSFTRITAKYISYDNDGRALAPVAVGFDITTNVKM